MDSYAVCLATPEQDAEARKRESVEWGVGMTLEQFSEREDMLDSQPFARNGDGGRRRWVLVPKGDEETLDFLAACETYRRKIMIRHPENEIPVTAISYSIASVFVPAQKRRKGYAAMLMKLLHGQIQPASPPSIGIVEETGRYGKDGILSFLFSDVGKFYEPLGWHVNKADQLEWGMQAIISAKAPSTTAVTEADIPALATADESVLRQEIAQPAPRHLGGPQAVRFTLSDPQGLAWRWSIARSKFYASRAGRSPTVWGARVEGLSNAFAVWAYNYQPNTLELIFLRLRFSSREELLALVAAARAAASKEGLKRIVAWNVDLVAAGVADAENPTVADAERLTSELAGANLVTRTSKSLPCIAWYGAEHGGKVDWIACEKGWWC
ncbi:hypothetical protein K437DRAFT_252948 [Tilletiaria anomala UBC 951]|uniref:LYC1 C-terminal domain-containing protein n=1 Tax=Tilletiaria anomala (strain ATCC 24038 / CBS 436.72 / UBC 951) TaxID=1037660 RepID=A0A066WIB5_TILAU|nr:uncharacterized protein K437DRAFT_252948 [Tilletiaria anomala UBC 951]KDN53581.1 hypothetical protein K437DRAFT_252948 [Tilletiaria anomala UBC 951]